MWAELEYSRGAKTQDLERFDRANLLFPLKRVNRTGPAYARIVMQNTTMEEAHYVLTRVLEQNPNHADLWFNLAQLDLKLGLQSEYEYALGRLQRLTPQNTYQAVWTPGAKGTP